MKQKYYGWHKAETGFMDIIEPFLDSNMVLDIGCGSGWVGKVLKEFNRDITVIGLDIDLVGLKEAKKEERILSSAEKLPFKDNTFDGIIAKDVLEHLLYPLKAVLEFNRVLKEDCRIYISVPDVKSKTFWNDYTHIRPFNKKSLTHLLEDAGFRIEKLWYSASWPGLGVIMRFLKINKTPLFIKFLAMMGRRQNVNAVAIKTSYMLL